MGFLGDITGISTVVLLAPLILNNQHAEKTDEMRKSHKIPFSGNWNEQETREEENPENDDQDEDYENIWKATSPESRP
jgi:hypothetical protein